MPSLRTASVAVLLLHLSTGASAQVPRLQVSSCAAADSILGPLSKEILKAEIYGRLGPGALYEIHAGPLMMRDYESEVFVHYTVAPVGLLPGGYLTAVFPTKIMRDPIADSRPMQLILDDTLTLPLGTPTLPSVDGHTPPSLPVKAFLRPYDLLALARAKTAQAEYLGKMAPMDADHRKGAVAALRVALCHLAAHPS